MKGQMYYIRLSTTSVNIIIRR